MAITSRPIDTSPNIPAGVLNTSTGETTTGVGVFRLPGGLGVTEAGAVVGVRLAVGDGSGVNVGTNPGGVSVAVGGGGVSVGVGVGVRVSVGVRVGVGVGVAAS